MVALEVHTQKYGYLALVVGGQVDKHQSLRCADGHLHLLAPHLAAECLALAKVFVSKLPMMDMKR